MKWNIIESQNYKKYIQKYNIHSLLAKVMDYKQQNHMDIDMLLDKHLRYHDFSLFLDGDMALDRIHEAIEMEEKICIYGDFDCDGILSTAILVEAFLELGVNVGYHIPHRLQEGYGLNKERVIQMHEKGYSLIITVDNGIKAFDAIEKANELGIDVIVVDHHEFDDLPNACAIIHTKISPDYPFKEICGGFLTYKLASTLLEKHDKYLFSLAAIATIADMMPLIDENRSLVQRALQFMEKEHYPQIDQLLGKQEYNVTNIGFSVAPKINSFGRLPEMIHPNHLVRYFLKKTDHDFILKMAVAASKINSKRQEMTTSSYNIIKKEHENDDFLYIYDQNIHQGIVGLIAGRYTREFQRPSFVMHYDEYTNTYKGSARSIEDIPLNMIFEALKDDMVQYGGHALAGGFSVDDRHLFEFQKHIAAYLDQYERKEPILDMLVIDPEDLTMTNIKELEYLEPFGNGNENVLFLLENVQVLKTTVLKDKHIRYDLSLPQGNIQALYFNCPDIELYKKKTNISIAGQLKINTFFKKPSINMIIEAMK